MFSIFKVIGLHNNLVHRWFVLSLSCILFYFILQHFFLQMYLKIVVFHDMSHKKNTDQCEKHSLNITRNILYSDILVFKTNIFKVIGFCFRMIFKLSFLVFFQWIPSHPIFMKRRILILFSYYMFLQVIYFLHTIFFLFEK